MFFITPSYCKNFRCSAGQCSDNCCIGWEIGIDADTLDFYRSVGGTFGERLQKNISADGTFILQNERCPFLNGKNLCDIIINCGEEHLCQICRDHPRYFEWYPDRKEGGIGLSCEEAARLILTTDEVVYDVTEVDEEPEEADEELYRLLCAQRDGLLEITDRTDRPAAEVFSSLLVSALALQTQLDGTSPEPLCDMPSDTAVSSLCSLFSDFEPIDEEWESRCATVLHKDTHAFSPLTPQENAYLVNLCRYFLWRYFLKGTFDGEVLSKVKFAVVSTLVIRILCEGKTDLHTWITQSKLYSKEMEYSDENRDLFCDYTYEKQVLSTPALLKILREVLQ